MAVVAKLPDIASNPLEAGKDLVSGIAGQTVGKVSGGLSDDMSKSPIEIISARGAAKDGKVTVDQAVVRSSVFEADLNGTLTLATELTNSAINFPISIWMSVPIIQRFPILASSSATTNTGYVKMPDFYVEKGTLGNPKPSLSAMAFGKDVIQRIIPGLGGGTNGSGNLLQGVGNLLQGVTGKTNQSSTNQPSGNNLLNRLLK